MKVVVVGAGAMGCLYAGMFLKSGIEVWLFEKNPEHIAAVKKNGLFVEYANGRLQAPFNNITSDPKEIGTADLIIVFVKAYDTSAAMVDSREVVSDNTTVLTLQNGLGNVEKIREFVSEEQILAGTTAHGATLIGHGHVKHSGIGETVIGGFSDDCRQRALSVKEIFDRAAINTVISDDIYSALWGKLMINIAINPITAIMRIKNGQIIKNPYLVEIMRQSVGEALNVFEKLGIGALISDPVERIEQVCCATSENISSMLQDIKAGRRTEIDYLNGAVVEYGIKVGIPTPVNKILTCLVRSLEKMK